MLFPYFRLFIDSLVASTSATRFYGKAYYRNDICVEGAVNLCPDSRWVMVIVIVFAHFVREYVLNDMLLFTNCSHCTALCPLGVNMFEAYRQKCSAEDLSRLKVALCSGEILSRVISGKHCLAKYKIILIFFCNYSKFLCPGSVQWH